MEADGDGGAGCVNACTVGTTRCEGTGVQTCSTGGDGCTAWGATVSCPSQSCAAGQCLCGTAGTKECLDNGVRTCGADGGWTSPVACGAARNCEDGGCQAPASCTSGDGGVTNCASADGGTTSCCTSFPVTGGTFDRSYDDVTYTNGSFPATVSGFRLDRFEITVGRFRPFVAAVVGGWRPSAGAGVHTHLNGGQGLNATGGGHETGWDATNWNGDLATTTSDWNTNLVCDPTYETWTPSVGANESLPVGCVTWYEAYAFCIYDGGFLPSEAEWNYAAAGGGGSQGQRAYPWSVPSTATTIDCALANYAGADGGLLCEATGAKAVGSESPAGDGLFGQADLAGNVWEWNLDEYAMAYVDPCPDCANLTPATNRVLRGASFNDATSNVLVSTRYDASPTARFYNVGARCARVP